MTLLADDEEATPAPILSIWVPGVPEPQGSMRSFTPKGWQRPILTSDNPDLKAWRARIAGPARHAMGMREPVAAGIALTMTLVFYMPRPRGHFGTGKNEHLLKASAPRFHTVKPDADKLARAVGDALTGIVYHDDSQVVDVVSRKCYGGTNEQAGTGVMIGVRFAR